MITLSFTGEAEPAGSGFQVLDSDSERREPVEVTTEDGSTWKLRFDPAVAVGTVGVRWSVQAPDAQLISGGFSFTVTTDAVADSAGAGAGSTEMEATPDATVTPAEADNSEGELDSFLEEASDEMAPADRLSAVGRVVTLLGTLLGVGALVSAATALRGTRRDVRHVMHWVRRAGVLVLFGAVLELVAQLTVAGGGWSGVWSPSTVVSVVGSSFRIAIGLHLLGGAAALLAANLFDGHTVTKGPRLVTAVVDVVHVAGAGVVLAVIILDSPSELWGTEWGRLLIAKTVFVVAAAAAGAYNHRVLIPQMSHDPASPQLPARFRSVITAEAAALLVVLVLTAFLMGAAS